MKKYTLVPVVFLLLVLNSCSLFYIEEEEERQPVTKPYAVYIYMDADNNLDDARDVYSLALRDINEMENVNSGKEMHVILMVDRNEYAANSGAVVYEVRYDKDEDVVHSSVVKSMGEVNMGSEDTLKSFLDYAAYQFPAEQTALVMWSHGSGWKSTVSLKTTAQYAVGYDVTSEGDALSLAEIKSALQGRETFNLLVFDACLMGTIETMYELRNYADYVMASQSYLPGSGLEYSLFLETLSNGLQKENYLDFMEKFAQYTNNLPEYKRKGTLSLIETEKLENLTEEISAAFSETTPEEYLAAIAASAEIDDYDSTVRDASDFLDKLPTYSATQIAAAYEEAVLFHFHTELAINTDSYDSLTGINITVPTAWSELGGEEETFRSLEFPDATALGEFIEE